MYSHQLLKPDGRQLTLYSRFPFTENIIPTGHHQPSVQINPHLRWHPLRGEWVGYLNEHQEYHPKTIHNELPPGKYDIAVFDHSFPALTLSTQYPPECIVETVPATGFCEIVVFSHNPQVSLSSLELAHLDLLLEVWGVRTQILGANQQIQYVLPFENTNLEVGVTSSQPHSQIYGYPFIPPVPARMLDMQRRFYQEHQRSLLTDLIQKEIAAKERIIYQDEDAIAFVPVCARYPYEVWLAPIQPVSHLFGLNVKQRWGLAKALKTVTLKYNKLWNRPFPYLMAWFQAPTDGKLHPQVHLHAEFCPPCQITGSGLAGGMFVNDTLPEKNAKELQAVIINI